MSVRIIIGADIVPTKSNYHLFREGDVASLIGAELQEKLNSADFTIFNLEVPLTDRKEPIEKCGPNLIAPTDMINGLKAINPHFFTLANNHILDQGAQGLESTINLLDSECIAYAGAGDNLQEAAKPYIAKINGLRIGIYCCAEHEFSVATETTSGANPYDPLYSFDHVRNLKSKTDFVIVLYHGGKEEYRYPSPMLQRVFRKFADSGADFIVAQHTHCIGCEEKYHGSTLLYGQGNFLFDNCERECWQTALLAEICLDDSGHYTLDYIPVAKDGCLVRAADNKPYEQILGDFKKRSDEIVGEGAVTRKFDEYVKSVRKSYWGRLSGRAGRMAAVKVFNKLSGGRFMDYLYADKFFPPIENCFGCEAHREVLLRLFELSRAGKEVR